MVNNLVLNSTVIILFMLLQASNTQSSFPQSVINAMATRQERYHHYLWHNIRNNWNRLSSDTQEELRSLGWAPPRPAREYDSEGNSYAISDNNAGEDFLYMHRQMIAKVNSIIAQNNEPYGKVTGWKTLPAPGDRDFPVPPSYTIPGNPSTTSQTTGRKATSFYTNTIRPLELTFTDPDELRSMTLGELGSRMEFTIHSYIHMRFSSSSSYGYRTGSGILPDFDEKWDDPSYDWLGDSYASHVHPLFWKIHGWIDDRIEDWRRANGLSSIRWKGTWVGGPMSQVSYLWDKKEVDATSFRAHIAQGDDGKGEEVVVDTMREVARIFLREGFESTFADIVILDFKPKRSRGRKLCKKH